MADKLIFF